MKAALLAVLLTSKANAGSLPVLVLPLEGDRKDVRAVEKKLKKAFGKKRQPTKSTRTMAQLQEEAACAADSPACLAAVGRVAGADEFVFGSVLRDGRMLHVLLRRFSVAQEREAGRAQAKLKRPSSRAMAKLVAELLRDAAPPSDDQPAPGPTSAFLGALEIQSAVPDVLIRLNGQPRGSAPLRLDDIGVATYDIEAEREGYKPWRGQATVEAGKLTTVQVELEALPAELRARAAGGGAGAATGLRTRTWVAAGITGALLAGAAVFGALTLSEQNDFDRDADALAPGDPTERALELEDRADSGKQKAMIANVLFIAAGAAAAATGVLIVLDVTDDSGEPTSSIVLQPGSLTVHY